MKKLDIPTKVTLIYAVLTILWIFFSDMLVYLFFGNTNTTKILGNYKGYLYAIISGFIIYKVLQNENNKIKKADFELKSQVKELQNSKVIEEKISFMAYHDFLTNLPNKYSFTEKLEIAIKDAIVKNTKGAVIFVDLDDFKTINDTFGHDYGDCLLKLAGDLLVLSVTKNGFVARHGGDEFFILIPEYNSTEDLRNICNSIKEDFKCSFKVMDKQLYTSGSMGITIFPDDGVDINTLYKNADTAMYESKKRGKNVYSFFDKKMFNSIVRRNSIEHELRNAVEKDELSICYQPIVNTYSGKLEGLEALIRWNNPELGNVTPGEFIPIAEETGLIIKIGKWVLETVASQHMEWVSKGYEYNHISINASPVQIQAEGFCGMIRGVVENLNIDPKQLEFEVTEGSLIKSFEHNADILKDMMSTGIKISIDDFGSGYSSLNYLTKLPIDTLKIDKSFIDKIQEGSNAKNIVNYIIKLSHELKYIVIAEGVETKEQLDILEEMGCDLIQGYYFSKPLTNHEIEKLLSAKESLRPKE